MSLDRLQPLTNEARQWRSFARRIDSLALALRKAGSLPADIVATPAAAETFHGAADGIQEAGRAIVDCHATAASAAIIAAARLLQERQEGRGGFASCEISQIVAEIRHCV